MFVNLVLALLVALAIQNVKAASGSQKNLKININPDTVDELDVPAYLGLWYQMAADKIVYATFEQDSYCDTALYGDNGDGTLSVHNYAKIGSPSNGTDYVIDGYAYQTKPEDEPGQLKVVFDSDDAAPFPAPYWILELGPKNADGLYDYAIVSDSLSEFLFVLARDVDTFNSNYKDSVYATLTDLGFTGNTAPIDTYQGSDCVYESTARKQQMLKNTKLSAPDTVDELNIASYIGLWYQMSADQAVYSTIEPDAYCVTALYGDNGDGTISVHNYQTTGAPDSGVDTIDGYAYQSNTEEPGQLNVVFPSEGSFPAPYWVFELGPINEDGFYDYSIVSDPFSLYLFVLARDVDTFNSKYKDTVAASLEKMGFTGRSAPIDTYQGSDCMYESTARKQQMAASDSTALTTAATAER